MKHESIKKKLLNFGIKIKSKEKDGNVLYRLRGLDNIGLENLLARAAVTIVEKSKKGIFILKEELNLIQLISVLESKKTPQKDAVKNDTEKMLKVFSGKMRHKAYSERTQKNYKNHFQAFLKNVTNEKPIDMLSVDDLNDYIAKRAKQKKYSIGDTNMHINTLRFYYEDVLGKKFDKVKIDRPKRPRKTVSLIDDKALQLLLEQTQNLKHQAWLILSYNVGLNVKELASLKTSELQVNNKATLNRLFFRSGSSINLSKQYQKILVKYVGDFSPTKYFFESNIAGKPITLRAIQKTLRQIKEKAGLL